VWPTPLDRLASRPMRRLPAMATVGCVAIMSACSSSIGSPVEAAGSPTATLTNAVCVVHGIPSDQSTHGLVTVSAKPTSAVATWTPGLNSKECQFERTPLTQAAAQQLAADIRHAPAFPKGKFNYEADDGTGVLLDFSYAGKAAEEVDLNLRGCSRVTAPGRSARQITQTLRRDLSQATPAAWASYLG
jgi:hypothetical protein